MERRLGAHLSFQGREPVGGNTTIVCDTWRRQTYTVTFPAGAGTRLILPGVPGDRGTHMCVNSLTRDAYRKARLLGVEPATY